MTSRKTIENWASMKAGGPRLHPAPFDPSPQQAAVIAWVRTGKEKESAFVGAVAGSGKTTLLVHSLAATTGTVAFCAFNKPVATEITNRVAPLGLGNRVKTGTFHSFGYGAVRRIYPQTKGGPEAARAKRDQVETLLRQTIHPLPNPAVLRAVPKLVSLAKQASIGLRGSLADNSLWYALIDHHDLIQDLENPDLAAELVRCAQQALEHHIRISDRLIDFDDMIYLPVYHGAKLDQYDWIFVDEAQDTNPARRDLARKLLKPGGRSLWVGDVHQAIYGFTGADADAVEQIIKDFGCIELPLTVTYRCPKAVVQEAQQVVSHITAHTSAPEGLVTSVPNMAEWLKNQTPETLTADDAILCRLTKPLVSLAFTLIRKGIACHVEGKEIGAGLLKLVDRWKITSLVQLRDKLEVYLERETEKLVAKGKETQAEALADRVETIYVLMDDCPDIACLRTKVASMFQDAENERKPTLTLSTVHKAKGREWNRVFILGRSEFMPSKWARQQWQQVQENNLIYVAVTRAKQELCYLPSA